MEKLLKKSLAVVIVLIISQSQLFAQAFKKGDINASIGVGHFNAVQGLFKVFENEKNYNSQNIIPLHFKSEYAISNKIGLGVSLNYVKAGAKYNIVEENTNTDFNMKMGYKNLSALVRMNVHFGNFKNLDLYYGVGVGYRVGKWWVNADNFDWAKFGISNVNPYGFETVFGMRYYLTPNIGLYTEVGYAKSLVQFGISGKF